jgi:ammonium transporter, Amt family
MGTLDFAGGTPVHICSGASSLAYSLFYKFKLRRHNKAQEAQWAQNQIPEARYVQTGRYDIVSVITGTVLLWIGWFGFNGGSALGANLRAVSACVSTTLAACAGGITGFLLDTLYRDRQTVPVVWLKNLVDAVSTGMVVGMVAVTPAAGYVRLSSLT